MTVEGGYRVGIVMTAFQPTPFPFACLTLGEEAWKKTVAVE